MTDGHTKQGSWSVTIKLTKDEADQLIRSMEWAKMMDGRSDTAPLYPPDYQGADEPLEITAHRAFLRDILNKLYNSIRGKDGQPEKAQTNRRTAHAG